MSLYPCAGTCYQEVNAMEEMQNREIFNQYTAEQNNINEAVVGEVSVNEVNPIESGIPQEGLLLLPLVFVVISWSIIYILPWALWKALRYRLVVPSGQRSHQIPCVNCRYFNPDPHLQCAVQPSKVLKTEARECPDYCSKSDPLS